MFYPKYRRVQRLPGEGCDSGGRFLGQCSARQFSLSTIDRITNQPMTSMSHMHADLVGAACFEPAFNEGKDRRCPDPLHQTRAGDGAAALAAPHHSLTLAIRAVAGEARFDPQHLPRLEADPAQAAQAWIGGFGHPVAEREVGAFGAMRLELRGKAVMRSVGLRDNQQARRVLIYAVYDPRALGTAHPGQAVTAMVQQRIDQRARRCARCRVDDHPGGFVYDDKIGILIDHIEGDGLGLCIYLLKLGNGNDDLRALDHGGLGIGRDRAIHPHRALLQQSREAGAA